MKLHFVTHPDVIVDPLIPIPKWHLSEMGISRMQTMLSQSWVQDINVIFSSTENKAVDGARIVANYLKKSFSEFEELGEIDRSSTGYIDREFWEVVEKFFVHPISSVKGWERAIDAQARIVKAVEDIVGQNRDSNVPIISHGAVGALLLAHLKNEPISVEYEQPSTNGGNYLVIDMKKLKLVQGWEQIDNIT